MKNSEAPGAANSSNPKKARRIPSTRTSHQGRVSPLLPADTLTLHLPRRLSTPSPHYGHLALTTASIPLTTHHLLLALIHRSAWGKGGSPRFISRILNKSEPRERHSSLELQHHATPPTLHLGSVFVRIRLFGCSTTWATKGGLSQTLSTRDAGSPPRRPAFSVPWGRSWRRRSGRRGRRCSTRPTRSSRAPPYPV